MATIVISGGSACRRDTAHTRAAFEFGRLVAREGWILRTGGGSGASVMGRAADGALAEGGRVEGVILGKFWRARHRGLHLLKSTATFELRKAALFKGVDGAVILPGGYGTLDEFGDLLALKQNGFVDLPMLLLNVRGYYDPLIAWMRRAGTGGFLYGSRPFSVVATPRGAVSRLKRLLLP